MPTPKKKKRIKSSSPLGKRIRRRIRKVIGPKQTDLKPAFKDGWVFHSQVRIGKRGPKSETFPEGKPKAIVVTKFRTMKKGTHADFEKRGRAKEEDKTRIGKKVRKIHIDELPQAISVLKGNLALVGLRPVTRSTYRKLPPELKKMYDEVGPGLIGLQHCCKSKKPSEEEFMKTAREFYEMWKKNKAKAYLVFGAKFLKNYKMQELPIEEIISGMKSI